MPRKRAAAKTPSKSFRPYPPEVWDRVKAKAKTNDETITDVLNRALRAYDKRHPDPPQRSIARPS